MNISPIIDSFYSGAKFTYNIVLFVDKILEVKLLFDEEKLDEESKHLIPFFSIKSKIPSTEPIPISFIVPKIKIETKSKNYILKGNLEKELKKVKLSLYMLNLLLM